jgi:hypothetical protein
MEERSREAQNPKPGERRMENMAANFVTAMFLTGQGHDHRERKLMTCSLLTIPP